MDYKLVIRTAVLAGELMLLSGAETYRVEDTMNRILQTAGTQTAEALVFRTGILATIDDPDIEPVTMMHRVKASGTNLNRIMQVNAISRKYCAGEMTLLEAYEGLGSIQKKKYKIRHYNLATIIIPAGFAPLFGGQMPEMLLSALAGALLALIITAAKKWKVNGLISDVVSSFVVVMAVFLLGIKMTGVNIDVVIISAIMPLVPGVAITNAVRDIVQGDYMSGNARVLEAFLTAAGIAIGAGAGMWLARLVIGGGMAG